MENSTQQHGGHSKFECCNNTHLVYGRCVCVCIFTFVYPWNLPHEYHFYLWILVSQVINFARPSCFHARSTNSWAIKRVIFAGHKSGCCRCSTDEKWAIRAQQVDKCVWNQKKKIKKQKRQTYSDEILISSLFNRCCRVFVSDS